jgi:hypothetical protein
MLGGDKEVSMRIAWKALLPAAVCLGALAAPASAGAGLPAIAGDPYVWVQPPASIPVAAKAPAPPAIAGSTYVWVQPPAWVPIWA